MTTTDSRTIFPEDVIVALFYVVGPQRKVRDDITFDDALHELSQKDTGNGVFVQFRRNRIYRISIMLRNTLAALVGAGEIHGELKSSFLYASEHTCGAYGKNIFERFTPDEQQALRDIAESIAIER